MLSVKGLMQPRTEWGATKCKMFFLCQDIQTFGAGFGGGGAIIELDYGGRVGVLTYKDSAHALVEVRQSLHLTTEGVLAYLLNRLLADADNLKVTDSQPAKMSQRDEL